MRNGDSAVTVQPENPTDTGLQDSPLDGHTNGLSPRLLGIKAASTYLSISYWSMRTLVLNGEVPHIPVGNRRLIDRQDLDDWIDKSKERGV